MSKNKKSNTIVSLFKFLILIVISVSIYYTYNFYQKIYAPNIIIENASDNYIYIKTGANLNDLTYTLYQQNYISDKTSFEWICKLKKFTKVKPGKYQLINGMSNNDLVNLFRSGNQVPVKVQFNSVRTKEQLAGRMSQNIEADSLSILKLLSSSAIASKYGFNTETLITMFIPNTYAFYWNTSAEDFITRMAKEYKIFWNAERKQKAKKIGLSQSEVSILASIVEQETYRKKERPTVAGVYLNRLKRGIKLQADPTVIFAVGDFTIKRVLKKHLKSNSKYNTYKYKGLPPGPITLPSISSIDAVLNYQKHNYIFFCAKEDFSGYHNFASTLRQHNNNARKFQRALNQRRIYK